MYILCLYTPTLKKDIDYYYYYYCMYNVEFSVDELRELRKYFTSNVTEKQYKDITSNDTLSKAVTKIIYRQLS